MEPLTVSNLLRKISLITSDDVGRNVVFAYPSHRRKRQNPTHFRILVLQDLHSEVMRL